MKHLLLLRHAKSKRIDHKGNRTDHERPLARSGVEDARRLSKLLADSGLEIDRVLCSSAVRAQQTWAHTGERLSPEPRVEVRRALYMPTRETLLESIARLPDDLETVLIVGHNPSLEALALSLIKKGDRALRARLAEKFPTCGLCVLAWPGHSFQDIGSGEVSLRSFVNPQDHAGPRPRPRIPRKASPINLPPKPRLRETAMLLFADASAQLRENVEGARASEDPDFVHQLRVGVRRLRTALKLFKKALHDGATEALLGELTWLFRLLGALREYDVFLTEHIAPFASKGELRGLYELCEKERARRLHAVREALRSLRFLTLVRELLAFEARGARNARRDPRLKPFARKKLERRLCKVLANKAALLAHDVSTLHELRKEVKRLRYTCEFVRDAFPKSPTRRFLKRLERLQDVLGKLNDVAVGKRLLTKSFSRETSRGAKLRLREPLRARLSALEAEARESFEQAWQKFETAKPFWPS